MVVRTRALAAVRDYFGSIVKRCVQNKLISNTLLRLTRER
jgi:hypothetical protein